MSSGYPIVYKSDKVARSQTQEADFVFKITGAKATANLALINNPVLIGFDAASLTQALVEAFLGATSTAACATIFDTTSLGTDTIGFVIDMAGQVDKVYSVEATVMQSAGGTPVPSVVVFAEASQAALTSANTSAVAEYDGNIYGRIIAGNIDATTAGFIKLSVKFKSI